MSNKKNNLVSIFSSKEGRDGSNQVNLWYWLLKDKTHRAKIDAIRSTTSVDEQKRLKSQLPAVTVSGTFSCRKADCLETPTNLICIDIDGKDNPTVSNISDLKAKIREMPSVIYCGLSASGSGLMAIIRYQDHTKHKLYFEALKQDFADMGIVIDSHCGDICRLRFYSYDDAAYINPYATIYDKVLEVKKPVRQPFKLDASGNENAVQPPQKTMSEMTQDEVAEELLKGTDFSRVSNPPLTPTQNVQRLLSIVIEEKVDITEVYRDWFIICCIIVQIYGEAGRDLFHQVSEFYPNYKPDATDIQYTEVVNKTYLKKFSELTEICTKYGIS